MNWRRSEWISVTTLITLAGWIAWASSKKTVWDETAMTVEIIRPKIEMHEQQLAVINAKLDDMQEDLKYLRRHTR
jgi:hypothetical protein